MIFLDLMTGARRSGGLFLALSLVACASAEPVEQSSSPSASRDGQKDAGSSTRDARSDSNDDDAPKARDAGAAPVVHVSAEAAACAAGLPFKPDGCSCETQDETTPCWTGKPGDRNRGKCRDGVQKCASTGSGEFNSLTWGSCEGEVTDCGEPPAPEEACGCLPGTVIACDEDCATLVICTLTGAKTCQPDGTWGPCREQVGTGTINPEVVLGCRNFFHGCLPFAPDGVYVGDCTKTFTCGHVPGMPAAAPVQ